MNDAFDKPMRGIVSPRGEGHSIPNPVGGEIEFKARVEQTGGVVTAFESFPAPGEGPPLHIHQEDNEVIYFLDGEFRMKVDDVVRNAPAGSFVFIPKGVPHTWQSVGDVPGRLLVIFVPGTAGMEQFFERFAAHAAGDPSAAEAFVALGKAAGMMVVGPPLMQSDPLS